MEDDCYEGCCYEDSADDYNRFEEQQLFLDREAEEYDEDGYDDGITDESTVYGREDALLDMVMEDRLSGGDIYLD